MPGAAEHLLSSPYEQMEAPRGGRGLTCSQRLYTGLIQSLQSILIANTLSVAGAIMHHGKHLALRDYTPKYLEVEESRCD